MGNFHANIHCSAIACPGEMLRQPMALENFRRVSHLGKNIFYFQDRARNGSQRFSSTTTLTVNIKDDDDQDPSFIYQGCMLSDGACINPEYSASVSYYWIPQTWFMSWNHVRRIGNKSSQSKKNKKKLKTEKLLIIGIEWNSFRNSQHIAWENSSRWYGQHQRTHPLLIPEWKSG